jgi:hypothetical protein
MALDLSNIQIRKNIIESINSEDNKKRKATSLRQYRCYSDNLDQYVQERLLQSFSKETFQMMPMISSINLVKRITDQTSSIYNMPPERSFTELSKEQEDTVKKIYSDISADNKMMRSNRFYNLQGQNHVYVKLVDGKFNFVTLLNHNIDAIPSEDDPEKAECYVIANFDRHNYTKSPNNYSSNSKTGFMGTSDAGYLNPALNNSVIADNQDYKASLDRYTFWSAEYNFVCDGNGEIVGEDKTDILNALGMIPIVDVSQFKDYTYFVEQGSSTVEFCIDYNVALSDLMFITRLQGFAQGIISGDKEVLDKMTTIQLGPAHIIKLPSSPITGKETKLEFANRGSDIKGSQDSLNMLLANFLSSRGIDPKTISGTTDGQKFTSGFDRLLAMIERFEASRSDYDLFETVEFQIYEIIKKYLSVYSGTEFLDKAYAVSIPEGSEISVSFKKPELIQSDTEKVDTVIKKIENGLQSRVEAIMEIRGVDRLKAEEISKAIQIDNGLVINEV